MRKPTFWFSTWSDTNQAVQLQKMARGLKFLIEKVEGLYCLCSENKGTDQLICVFVFAYAKRWFSHGAAHIEHITGSVGRFVIVTKTFKNRLQNKKSNDLET